jgi:hypothetical protein
MMPTAKTQAVEPNLPPPGDERREVLAERTDALAQAAEELAEKEEVYRVDPGAMEVESELAQYFDEFEVSGALDDYAYCWVNCMSNAHGRFVQWKLSRGWEVVCGNMPEALALKQADGTRRLGDVLLMRIRRERKEMLDAINERNRMARAQGVASDLLELGERNRKHGVVVHVDGEIPEETLARMERGAEAQRRGTQAVDKMLRQGRMPGMPMRGRR